VYGDSHREYRNERELITWRKVNALHAWFVRNVQDGRDDCGDYLVTRAQLASLLDDCETVLAGSELVAGEINCGQKWTNATGWRDIIEPGLVIRDTTIAERLLPTQSGFFFGSTQYDEGYLDDLRRTHEALKSALAAASDGDVFTYWSGW
jgi:hypothetical protein